ncbi:MAG: hypothetical protein Q8J64_06435 [Thermodesulfovibrionales bacterium]|nr:hypothetical protein [Thermodesulfovibrionales bacterium]
MKIIVVKGSHNTGKTEVSHLLSGALYHQGVTVTILDNNLWTNTQVEAVKKVKTDYLIFTALDFDPKCFPYPVFQIISLQKPGGEVEA